MSLHSSLKPQDGHPRRLLNAAGRRWQCRHAIARCLECCNNDDEEMEQGPSDISWIAGTSSNEASCMGKAIPATKGMLRNRFMTRGGHANLRARIPASRVAMTDFKTTGAAMHKETHERSTKRSTAGLVQVWNSISVQVTLAPVNLQSLCHHVLVLRSLG